MRDQPRAVPKRVVFVRCKLSRGGFPSERSFAIEGFDRSICDENYCYAPDRKTLIGPIEPDQTSPLSGRDGYVVGLLFARMPDGRARVECPDGEVYHLDDTDFVLADDKPEANA